MCPSVTQGRDTYLPKEHDHDHSLINSPVILVRILTVSLLNESYLLPEQSRGSMLIQQSYQGLLTIT